MSALRIDHVLISAADLNAGAEQLRRAYGLQSVAGGRHPGLGTANRLVALGDSYLELLAVVDDAEAQADPMGRRIAELLHPPGRLAAWFVRCDDAAALARRIGGTAVEMSRRRPDGRELRWRIAHPPAAGTPGVPSFIEWNVVDADHPGRSGLGEAPLDGAITSIEIADPTGDVAALFAVLELDALRIVDGPPGIRRVVLRDRGRELVIGADELARLSADDPDGR